MTQSKYDELISALTDAKVKLVDVNGEYRSTYDIMADIAAKWDDLSSMEQSALATSIAGTRMQNIFFSMIKQFKEASGAMDAMANSEGTLAESYSIYLDTTQAHVEQLSAAFQELSTNAMDSKLMSWLVDIGSMIIGIINDVTQLISNLGGLKTVLLATVSVVMILRAEWVAHNIAMITTRVLTAVANGFRGLVTGIQSVINIIPAAIAAWQGYAAGTVSAGAAMQATIPVIGLVLAALTLLVGGIALASSKTDESIQKTNEAAQNAANLSDEIADLTSQFLSLSSAVDNDKNAKERLVGVQDKLIEKLGLEKDKIDELTKKYGSYTEAIKQAAIQKLREERTDISAGVGTKRNEVIEAAKDITKDGKISFSGSETKSTAAQKRLYNASKALEDAGFETFGVSTYDTAKQKGWDFTSGVIFQMEVDANSIKDIKKARDELKKALDVIKQEMKNEEDTEGTSNDFYQNTYNQYRKLNEAITAYEEQSDALNESLAEEYILQGLVGKEIPKTTEDFQAYKKGVIDAAEASGEFGDSTRGEIEDAIDGVLRKDSAFVKFYTDSLDDMSSKTSKSINSVKELLDTENKDSDKTFADKIKDYKTNLDELNSALEKIQNNDYGDEGFSGLYAELVSKFPQLAGRAGDLQTAISDLINTFNTELSGNFEEQLGKLDSQESIDSLKEYENALISAKNQNNAFAKSYGEIQSKIEGVMSWAKKWNELTNGNVDYTKRPLVSPEKMKEAFPDFEGEIATTYTQYFSIGEGEAVYTIDITPILEDGTVLNQESLEEYVDKLITDNGIEGILASDDLNLVVNVVPGDYDEAYWADYQSKLNAAKNTHWELIKQLQEETGLAWDEIVEKYGAVIDTATKFNSKIDETVSAFSTLKSVMEDYRDNGYLTLDNLTSILELDDKYIAALTNEKGAIDLSTESYKKLVAAELEELRAQMLQDSINTVNNITTKAAALEYLESSQESAARASLNLADAQWREAIAAAAARDAEQGTGDLYQRTVIRAREVYQTKMALIDSYEETAFTVGELQTATDDYTNALNNEKDALESAKDALEDQKDALEDMKDGYEDALNSIKDLIDWVEDYIKQIKNDEIDALQEKKDAIDELIEAQKDLLDAEKDEYEWNKKISEKQNTVAKDALAASIASLDDSSAGRKAQKQANDKLAESRSDMLDTLYDHEIEIRKDALDKLKEEQDEYYDNLIENIQDYLDNEVQLYKDACAMIDNDSGDLYGKLLWYCQNYTTTTEAEFNHMWNSAQSALQQYNTANLGTFELLNDLQGRIYEVDNAIDTIAQSISSYESAIDGVQGKLDNLSKSAQKAISDIQAAANAEDEWTKPKWVYTWQGNDYKSWKVNRDAAISDIIKQIESRYGGVFPASAATIYGAIRKYASGTNSAAGGLSLVGERGAELRVLNSGDGILKNQIVRGLTSLGANPAQFIADAGQMLMKNLFGNRATPAFGAIGNNNQIAPNIVVTIQGDATQSTVDALKAQAKKIMNDTIKTIRSDTLMKTYSSRVR